MRSPLIDFERQWKERADGGGMGDQNRLEKDFEALAALLADIARDIESESEEDRSRIRELHQRCMLELALLRKAEKRASEKKDADSSTICQ
jgi:hypothetical protein